MTPASILLAAGACGLQNTPPGSAALALNARVANLTPDNIDSALVKAKTLLQAWSLRASPHIFPTADFAVFTVGLLPTDEESIRSFICGVEPALEKIGITMHRHVWRHAGNPGVVLANGQFIETWRAEKKSKRLQVTVEQFGSLCANLRSQLQAEAATLAPFKGCTSVEVAFTRAP